MLYKSDQQHFLCKQVKRNGMQTDPARAYQIMAASFPTNSQLPDGPTEQQQFKRVVELGKLSGRPSNSGSKGCGFEAQQVVVVVVI